MQVIQGHTLTVGQGVIEGKWGKGTRFFSMKGKCYALEGEAHLFKNK